MIELLAGVLVAAVGTAEGAPVTAEKLIEQMRGRLLSRCPACDTASEPGSAFCSRCGAVLLDTQNSAQSSPSPVRERGQR